MIQFLAAYFLCEMEALNHLIKVLESADPQSQLSSGGRTDIIRVLDQLNCCLKESDFSIILANQIKRLSCDLQFQNIIKQKPTTADVVKMQLISIRDSIRDELSSITYAFIPKTNAQYFEKKYQFGENVEARFPGLSEDIKEAGNCLAADLPTASVFHLMRIAEIGMRSFRDHLGAPIIKQQKDRRCPKSDCEFIKTKPGNPRETPAEYAMWEEVISALQSKTEELENSAPKGIERTRDFKTYYELLEELKKFKSVDRNELMHARRKYNYDEAVPVFNAVKSFMIKLSALLSKEEQNGKQTNPV